MAGRRAHEDPGAAHARSSGPVPPRSASLHWRTMSPCVPGERVPRSGRTRSFRCHHTTAAERARPAARSGRFSEGGPDGRRISGDLSAIGSRVLILQRGGVLSFARCAVESGALEKRSLSLLLVVSLAPPGLQRGILPRTPIRKA